MTNLTFEVAMYQLQRWACMAIAASVVLALTGCHTIGGVVVSAAEYETFTPKAPEKRVLKEVNLRWEVREDVAQYCAKSMGMGQEQAYFTPPVACALWHVAK